MAVKYIDCRDGDCKEDITEVRYKFDDSESYWVLNEHGILFRDPSTDTRIHVAVRGELRDFFTMMETIAAQETFNRLQDAEDERSKFDDDIPF